MKEMNQWEVFCDDIDTNETYSSDESFKLEKDRLVDIFDKYCTKKERKNGKPNVISYGLPPSYQYDLNTEYITSIEEVDKAKYLLYTKKGNPVRVEYSYTFKKVKDQWLLDSKKRKFLNEDKWSSISL